MDKEYSGIEKERFDRGFNRGNLFAKYEPELMKDLLAIDTKDSFLDGLRAGQKEYERTQKVLENESKPKWLQEDRVKNAFNDKSNELKKDKDSDKDR